MHLKVFATTCFNMNPLRKRGAASWQSALAARWVPRLLLRDQQEIRADLSMEIMNKWDENPEEFLQRIVGGDKTWLLVRSRGQNSIETVVSQGRKCAGQSKQNLRVPEEGSWPLSSGMRRDFAGWLPWRQENSYNWLLWRHFEKTIQENRRKTPW